MLQYESLNEFVRDFNLIMKNAKTFNEEGSEIWADATYLQKYFEKYGSLAPEQIEVLALPSPSLVCTENCGFGGVR